MPALRYYYSDTISRFLTKNTEEIIGKLTLASQHDINDDTSNSWVEEIETLKDVLTPYKKEEVCISSIIFLVWEDVLM